MDVRYRPPMEERSSVTFQTITHWQNGVLNLWKGAWQITRVKPNYANAINEYERNGWARKLIDSEIKNASGPVFYLPHHGVYRPNKKSTPLRIVFEPACPYQRVSLNSFLYKGPCLIGSLLGVSLLFREEVVAFTGDILKMFLQVRLPESDCQVHRFLRRDLKTSEELSTYVLLRVNFCDKPSPDMASYLLLKIDEEHRESAPEAAEIIKRDRYIDDLIHSCPSTKDAIQRIIDVNNVIGYRWVLDKGVTLFL